MRQFNFIRDDIGETLEAYPNWTIDKQGLGVG